MFLSKSGIYIIKYCRNIERTYLVRFTSTKSVVWKPTIGLEIHAQILTNSKLFSRASTNFKRPVNSCVSLFDCAIPGTLPVLNKKCVEAGVLTALALSCEVNDISIFERKHYFYSDLPAGFQITQQKRPLAVNGNIKFMIFTPVAHKKPYFKSSKIKQIQLEQDSGRSLHCEDIGRSLVDLNRAGLPLMELVFEPNLSSGEEAAALVKELCFILQLLGTCSCKMEEGALRVDANVSVSKLDEPLGTRTELKNIGSISAIKHAVEYEINRQVKILEQGGKIINETRAWNPDCQKTVVMREKEENHDYRFIPETNLPPLHLHVNKNVENKRKLIDVPSLKEQLPELPHEMLKKLQDRGLTPASYMAVMADLKLFKLFYKLLQDGKHRQPQLVANLFISEILAFLCEHGLEISFCEDNYEYLEDLIDLLQNKVINYPTTRKLLNELLCERNKMPKQIIEEKNWFVISDEKKLEIVCLDVIDKYPEVVKKYKKGRKRAFKKLLQEVSNATNECADMIKASQIMARFLN